MDGKELFRRAVSTVQEVYVKVGDASGSVSLFYPFEGDFAKLEAEFKEASADVLEDASLECLPERVRIIVSEEDCRRILEMPIRATIRDIVSLIGKCSSIEDFRGKISEKYPDVSICPSGNMDFDWVMAFPEEQDPDIYCISEEPGMLSYHRFSEEEYLKFGFEPPARNGKMTVRKSTYQIGRN